MRHTTQLRLVLLLGMLTCFARTGFAQGEEKIKTDRPDQTEASTLIPKGTVQLEAGYFYQKATAEGLSIRTHAYPTALLRVGVLDRLELRVLSAIRDSVVENGVKLDVDGLAPLNLGLKVKLWEEQGWRPEAALLVRAALPVGSRAFRPDEPEPELRLSLSNEVTDKIEIAYNLTHSWVEGDPRRGYTVSLSGEVHNKLTVFGEVFGNKQKGEKAEHQADAGVLFLLLPHLQLDVAAGAGLNKAAPDFFFTTGIAVRLPR
ncbi:transporter [Pontibacter litorisediminis]|uniref:transporter n=1 Tax=Pontibacter litorisediminis TaxID=1846260 RepID=UPI0023EC52EA|nr:transporter [Pontibacter litorisediminis]